MVVQNTYNRKTQEYNRIDDIYESDIKQNRLNITGLERHLLRVNVGSKRRERNGHAERLARFKQR